jgi:mono/diheme cytochrome c family protein
MTPRFTASPVFLVAGVSLALSLIAVTHAQERRSSGGTGLAEPVAAGAKGPSGLGRTPNARELAAQDISIGPDGAELPPGSGTATQGALTFTQRACSTCHGPTGKEGPAPVLVGGKGGYEESY